MLKFFDFVTASLEISGKINRMHKIEVNEFYKQRSKQRK